MSSIDISRRGLLIGAGMVTGIAALGCEFLSSAPASAAGVILWPNGTTTRPSITSPFGPRIPPIKGASDFHRGTDFVGYSAVRSVADGTVQVVGTPSGWEPGGVQVWIQHDGFQSRSLHLEPGTTAVTPGQHVSAGDVLGTMGHSGNVSGVHHHLEIVVSGVQIDPVPYLTARISGSSPVATDHDRSFSITTAGVLQAKAGMYEPVIDLRNSIVSMDADGTTIAAVDTSGNVWVQQGGFSTGWVGLAGGAKAVAVDGNRFVVLQTNGTVIAKDGLYSTTWLTQADGVDKIAAADGRLGVLKGGHVYVKEGNLQAAWVDQGGGMSDFALDGNRVGVVFGGTVYVKEGDLYAAWVVMRDGSRVGLEGTRVVVLDPDGIAWAKEGNLWSSWTNLTGPGINDFALSGNRIAVRSGGSVLIKAGGLDAAWIGAYASSTAVALA